MIKQQLIIEKYREYYEGDSTTDGSDPK